MSIKIAINGLGRTGRCALKSAINNKLDLDIVAVNDLTDAKTLAHLIKYDTNYGRYGEEVEVEDNDIVINGKKIKLFAEKDPANLPWKDLKIDVVLECTGKFKSREGAGKHLTAGAKKVIISAPADGDDIPSYLIGINADQYKGENIIDMGSCTTNCLAPLVKIIEEEFGIVKGYMTTVHSYTNDQMLLDLPHKDLRRARAAAMNIIPTTTGAAKAIWKAIPTVKGKLDGIAIRVPTSVVSLIDLVCEVKKDTTVDEVNKAFTTKANKKELKGILYAENNPLVSSDFIGNEFSSIFDVEYTKVNGNMIKVMSWYDNEWAYATRLGELAVIIGNYK